MQRISLVVRADAVEEILDDLLDLVPQGIRELDNGGGAVELVVYGEAPALAELASSAGDALVRGPAIEQVPGDWRERRTRESRPRVVAERFVLRRPWDGPPPEGLIDILIDRARGFGTGAHPTTCMALELLAELPPEGAVVDLGCGAGVLSIAASKLGWDPVVGVELDPASAAEARANVALNDVRATVESADFLKDPIPEAGVVLANINPVALHVGVAGCLPAAVHTVLATGIAGDDEVAAASEAYEAAGFEVARRIDQRGWTAMLLRRQV